VTGKKKKKTPLYTRFNFWAAQQSTEACGSAVVGISYLCILGLSFSVHACHPRNVLPVY
jgi:hypothetical protein